MTARLASIHRFPVKSIGGETLAEAALTPRAALPGDRRFALGVAAPDLHVVEARDRQRRLADRQFLG